MTTAELNTFYSATNSSFFGYQLQQAVNYTYTAYSCPSAMDEDPTLTFYQNCSSTYLANYQWGSSHFTLNPPYTDQWYFPAGNNETGTNETLSVATWGVPGITIAPEYFYYSQFHYAPFSGALATPALTAWQVGNLTCTSYNYFGVGSTYNGKSL